MKKIYLELADGTKEFLGFAASLYHYLLIIMEKMIVPFHGHDDYTVVHNIYNEDLDMYVTYTSVDV